MKRVDTLCCFTGSNLSESFLFQFFETQQRISQESVNHQQVILLAVIAQTGRASYNFYPAFFLFLFLKLSFPGSCKTNHKPISRTAQNKIPEIRDMLIIQSLTSVWEHCWVKYQSFTRLINICVLSLSLFTKVASVSAVSECLWKHQWMYPHSIPLGYQNIEINRLLWGQM